MGLVDDNIFKKDLSISGKKVLGTTHDIINICEKLDIDVILFTISNIDKKNKRRILEECNKTNCKIKVLLGTMDMLNKDIMNSFKNFTIEDVLEREPIELENSDLPQFISGETVLITGGGGSIGSELCRQVLSFYPKEIIIFDVYENNLYDIEQELKRNYPKSLVRAIVGSVRDIDSIESVFKKYSPTLVFHAAAHKHVPLMETRPLEAIKNNVFGTYNTALLADKYNVKKFTLISTDKAVNPTNIMGATKRLCEMIIQAINTDSKTEYAAVRFGNVLGSNGSVIPLFKKQIANGGPITLTHKDIIRYFMTIPEAVSLVLCAATYAEGGELFVLDMGKPVKIYDLAVNLIKLSGLEPGVDIMIEETGLRPGEKLYEELLMDEENLKNTEHEKIFITKQKALTIKQLEAKLNKLKKLDYDVDKIKKVMKEIVPTYKEEGK